MGGGGLSWGTISRTRHEARLKNNRGHLPLHLSASFRAPSNVIKGLPESCPESALSTNNYGHSTRHFTALEEGGGWTNCGGCGRYSQRVRPSRSTTATFPCTLLELVEAMYHAYPRAGPHQKNNGVHTLLDLALADGTSSTVVVLQQGKSVSHNRGGLARGPRRAANGWSARGSVKG